MLWLRTQIADVWVDFMSVFFGEMRCFVICDSRGFGGFYYTHTQTQTCAKAPQYVCALPYYEYTSRYVHIPA